MSFKSHVLRKPKQMELKGLYFYYKQKKYSNILVLILSFVLKIKTFNDLILFLTFFTSNNIKFLNNFIAEKYPKNTIFSNICLILMNSLEMKAKTVSVVVLLWTAIKFTLIRLEIQMFIHMCLKSPLIIEK